MYIFIIQPINTILCLQNYNETAKPKRGTLWELFTRGKRTLVQRSKAKRIESQTI